MTQAATVVGLISDTHGLLRAKVFDAFEGVDLILHAGDVGGGAVLEELRTIAPVHAVHGNTDLPGSFMLTDCVELLLRGHRIHVSHGHELGSPTPRSLLARYDADIIVFGHTHKQTIARDGDRLVINPGSAGPLRFDLPASVALLTLEEGTVDVSLIEL